MLTRQSWSLLLLRFHCGRVVRVLYGLDSSRRNKSGKSTGPPTFVWAQKQEEEVWNGVIEDQKGENSNIPNICTELCKAMENGQSTWTDNSWKQKNECQ